MTVSPVPDRAADRSRYRADIDGLRAIAVTSVVCFHAGLVPFASGFIGVDVFFVISGYLIGAIILREAAEGRFSFARFYARRARRILPALIVVILFTCVAGSLLLTANEFKDVGGLGTLALVGVSNINFWQFQDYFADDSRLRTLLMTWSLGVEEQFYVVFPFIILLTMRFARRWLTAVLALLTLGSFALSLWWTQTAPAAAFYLLPARAWELGAGVMLAALEAQGRGCRLGGFGLSRPVQQVLAAAGLGALIIGTTCFDEHTPFPGVLALLPVLATVALMVSPDSTINRSLLSCRPMRFVGLISYSWYLWHWPLLSLLRNIVPQTLPVAVTIGVAGVSFGVAVLSWRYVEQPFRHARLAPSAVLLRYACALVVVVAAPIAIRSSGGFPQRFSPRVAQLETFVTELRRGKCLVAFGPNLSDDPDCRAAAAASDVVAVLGDSHAWAVGPSLRQLATKDGLGYEIFAKSSCTPLIGVSARLTLTPGFPEECTAFKNAALQAILSDPRVSVVILAGFWSAHIERFADRGYVKVPHDDPAASGVGLLQQGLKQMADRLTEAHKRVIILQDVPDMGIDPLRIAFGEQMPLRGMVSGFFDKNATEVRSGHLPMAQVAKHDDVRQAIVRVAAGVPTTSVKDPFLQFCDQTSCTFTLAGEPLYFDHHHLSPVGARLALSGFALTPN